jgi:drug/metabolite transporter (DMT)-like permease
MYSPPPGSVPSFTPGVVQQRNAAVVIVLALVTCGIYMIYWFYKTSAELQEALQDEDINPMVDLILVIVTCFIWGIYVEYRNSQKAYAVLSQRDPRAVDQTQTILILNIAQLIVGVTGLIATYILQEELNKLARLTN